MIDAAALRRSVFDVKRRMTQKITNKMNAAEGEVYGQADDDFKNANREEIFELKKMLIKLASSIKSYSAGITLISEANTSVSLSMLELSTERRESGSKGYAHADPFGEATAAVDINGRACLSTLQDAHDSLLRKIADFKTIEKQV